jgi:hypothetical protein
MTTQGLLYTDDDIRRFLASRRFLAAVHAYSMGRYPLGEAVMRATEGYPKAPRSIGITGYNQLIQEVAERIVDGKITVPEELRPDYSEIYTVTERSVPEYYGAEALMFSELREPGVKKEALNLYRRTYDEEDIQEFVKDRRFLAAIDAYMAQLLTFGQMKEIQFGDQYAHPRELSFDAFSQLIFNAQDQIRKGAIQIPPGLKEEFPDIYHPPPVAPK